MAFNMLSDYTEEICRSEFLETPSLIWQLDEKYIRAALEHVRKVLSEKGTL